MNNRNERIAIAEETVAALNQNFYTLKNGENINITDAVAFAKNNTIWLRDTDFEQINADCLQKTQKNTDFITKYEVTSESVLEAAARLCAKPNKVFCLNFASAKNPGGGFLGGSQAQEESLARSSALYPCLTQKMEMYENNRRSKTCLYSDDMIYSPDVPVFRTDDGDFLPTYYKVSFLTSPAVNAGVVRAQEPDNISKIDATMLHRLEKVLSVALAKGYTTLLLGAWGCGVFRNDPADVAAYFEHHLLQNPKFKNRFERIVFAIYSPKPPDANLLPFEKIFSTV
jgi:uncharacterized protein (TIGR02452 family)